MICGAPPVGRNQMSQAFKGSPQTGAASKQDISEAEIETLVETFLGIHQSRFFREAVARTDGRFRKRLFEAARTGEGVDQRLIVESSPLPLAVVNGGADRLVNLDYFDTVAYANLWEGRCHRLTGLEHAPFWEAPRNFNPVLERFLNDVETCRAARKHSWRESYSVRQQNSNNYKENSL